MARVVVWGAVMMWLLAIVLPIAWGAMLSVKTRVDALAMPPMLAFRPTVANYTRGLIENGLWRTLVNSVVIASASSALALGLGVPAAYVFSRFRFRGSRGLFLAFLTTRLTPPLVLALPLFLVFARLRMIDNYVSIVAVHAGINVAAVVWIMKGFFDGVPRDIDDASLLDGEREDGVSLQGRSARWSHRGC